MDAMELRSLMSAAEQALERGHPTEALSYISRAKATAPRNPDVLAASGLLVLRTRDAAQAKALIEEAIALDPDNPRYRVNLAVVLRELADPDAELQALEAALSLDPYFFAANLQKGSLFELQGKSKQAANAFHAALSSLRPGVAIPSPLRPMLEHAQQTVQAQFHELEEWLTSRMAEVRAQYAGVAQDRVDDCLAAFVGRKRIYNAQPTMTHFPRLPAIPFFDRHDFPWLATVEGATEDIRQELIQVLQGWGDDFEPYVSHAPGSPLNQWKELNNSRRWSALFLYKDGQPHQASLERCPKTAAVLAQLPLVDIPNRAPTVFFSKLQPKTRIPPHTGSTNTRLIVHLPLIVPPACGFRVGAEVRQWQPGTALIFDDTLEHEAWNDSDEPRVVLIFDIWNPLLTPAECALMRVATASIAEFFKTS
jgi:aspartyl/asparaginyl beta-hydroxylase (cupin superfamily)